MREEQAAVRLNLAYLKKKKNIGDFILFPFTVFKAATLTFCYELFVLNNTKIMENSMLYFIQTLNFHLTLYTYTLPASLYCVFFTAIICLIYYTAVLCIVPIGLVYGILFCLVHITIKILNLNKIIFKKVMFWR